MMRHLLSEQLVDFAAIYDEDIELVSIARPDSASLETLSEQVFASRPAVQAQWEQRTGDPDTSKTAFPGLMGTEWLNVLSQEITLASDILGELLDCERVGVRVVTLRAPMCPRFHVDHVPCRMLITISGPGTEWIPSDGVDRTLLVDRDTDAPPIRAGREIKQMSMGSWSLLKGGTWNNCFDGIVHRSPHQTGERLLLSLDPIFRADRGDRSETAPKPSR